MKLNEADSKRLLDFYQEAHTQYGDYDARSVRWTTQYGQEKRFRVLLQVDDIQGHSVLDVGCGLGDLYKHMLRSEIEVAYTGIDVVPEFIETAQKRYPEAAFECMDIFDVKQEYDYVLASGALSFKVADNQIYYQDFIRKMYEVANKAVAFNLLDKRTHIDDETYAAYDIEEIADFCSAFAGQVEIVTDYLPRDFTVYLFK